VTVKNASAARAKLDRQTLARLEWGDADAAEILAKEFQADILINVTALPYVGSATHFRVRAMGTADAVFYGFVEADLPFPPAEKDIEAMTTTLSRLLMKEMAKNFAGIREPVEVRIRKAVSAQDAALVRKFLQKMPGVTQLRTAAEGADGGTGLVAIYATFNGTAEDFYGDVVENLALSKGLKASPFATGEAITLEVDGPLELRVQTMAWNSEAGKMERKIARVTPDGN
jgi:hypothetical protein